MKSLTDMSAISWPRPITIRWSAVSAISLMRWLETKTVRPSEASRFIRLRTQQDALRVEAVDRLVEEQHLRVAEQRSRDAEPLAHAEREATGALAGDVLQAHHAQHLVHPPGGDARQLGEAEQVAARAAAAVHRLGVEQRADLAGGVGEPAEGVAADRWRGRRSGASRPRIMRIVVDLPEPLGPRKPVTAPGRTWKDRLCTAVLAP